MNEKNCWEFHRCAIHGNCPAHPEHGRDCWNIEGTLCSGKPKPARSEDCTLCGFYAEEQESKTAG